MTRIRSQLLAAFFLFTGAVSCDEEAEPQGAAGNGTAAGYGGGAGIGGAAGAAFAGTGGTSGATAGGIYPPSCLQNIYSQCPAEGNCFFATAGGFRLRGYCYDSGVHFNFQYSSLEGTACEQGDQTTMQAYRSDGTLCYTEVTTTGPECASSTIVWTDSQGTTVATGSASKDPVLGTTTRVVNCPSGESASCEAGRDCPTFSCQEGVCP